MTIIKILNITRVYNDSFYIFSKFLKKSFFNGRDNKQAHKLEEQLEQRRYVQLFLLARL